MHIAPLIVAALATGCVIHIDGSGTFDEHATQYETLPADLTDLTLIVPAGDVTIVTGTEVGVDVELSWHRGDEMPRIVASEVGTVATHEWSCRSNRGCQIDLFVTVPEDMQRLDVDLEAGDLTLTDLSGTLTIDLEAGDVDIDGHTGDVSAVLEAGSIDATDLVSDDVDASVEAGSIDLALAARPTRVITSTSAGDIDLLVPAGAYALDLRASVGSTHIGGGITSDDAADATIQAHADVGSVRVDGY